MNQVVRAPDESTDEDTPDDPGQLMPEVRVLLPPGRLLDHKAVMAYRESLPGAISLSRTVLDGNVEILWVPDKFVCVLYHFFSYHAIPIPIGFVSSEPKHLKIAEQVILDEAIADSRVFELGTKAGSSGADRTDEFALLRQRSPDLSTQP